MSSELLRVSRIMSPGFRFIISSKLMVALPRRIVQSTDAWLTFVVSILRAAGLVFRLALATHFWALSLVVMGLSTKYGIQRLIAFRWLPIFTSNKIVTTMSFGGAIWTNWLLVSMPSMPGFTITIPSQALFKDWNIRSMQVRTRGLSISVKLLRLTLRPGPPRSRSIIANTRANSISRTACPLRGGRE